MKDLLEEEFLKFIEDQLEFESFLKFIEIEAEDYERFHRDIIEREAYSYDVCSPVMLEY